MTNIVDTGINNFLQKKVATEPSDELIFVLTATQLEEIIRKATEPIREQLEEQRLRCDALSLKMNRLENQYTQPLQKDRGEILQALLIAHNGTLAMSEARKIMRISKSRLSELVTIMATLIEIRPSNADKRKKILILKSKLVPRN